MYLTHYSLNEKPFTSGPDPRYLWFGDRQLGLYTSLEAAVLHGDSIILLTGDVGTGKTTFLKSLEAGLWQKTVFANISDPALNELDFYNLVAHGLGMDGTINSKAEFVEYMRAVARDSGKLRKRVVVAVDESQRIGLGLLRKFWHLARVESGLASEVTWIFVGQDELLEYFKGDGAGLLKEYDAVQFHMQALDRSETGAYIRFRMKRAGSKQMIFSNRAIERIYGYTAGHPRLINNICDLALLHAYTDDTRRINSSIIDECAGKICLPNQCDNKKVKSICDLKAAALLFVFAWLFCLTMSGVLTYRQNQKENPIHPSSQIRASVQSLLPVGEVQASLANADLQSMDSLTFFKIYKSTETPPEGRQPKHRGDDASFWDTTSGTHGAVSEDEAQYGSTEAPPGKIEKSPLKPAAIPHKAVERTDGFVTFDRSAPKKHGKANREEPNPSDIIDWLLEK